MKYERECVEEKGDGGEKEKKSIQQNKDKQSR